MMEAPEFCCGFFHIDECTEVEQKAVCMFPTDPCYRLVSQGVIVVQDGDGHTLFSRRYQHVQVALLQVIRDPDLQLLLVHSPGAQIDFYLGYYQFGDHIERILQWVRQVLVPHKIHMTIHCCVHGRIYRALEGLPMLLREPRGLTVTSMDQKHWVKLLALLFPEGAPYISESLWTHRRKHDFIMGKFLIQVGKVKKTG